MFHGYLLRGTGSNVYNASLARALAGLGHEVHLLCQDREAGSLQWIDGIGRWADGRLRVDPGAGGSSSPGSVTVYVPDIGGLLPVYVADRYEGFRVKRFAELTEVELDRYLDANVAAVPGGVAALGGGGRAARAAADAISHLAAAGGPRVVLVGKLIVSKGVDLLLAAWPLVHRTNPGARLLVVGFGEYAPALERLWAALAAGDLDQAREIASKGRALEGGEEKPLRMLGAFLAEPHARYLEAARDAAPSVAVAGRLGHPAAGSRPRRCQVGAEVGGGLVGCVGGF